MTSVPAHFVDLALPGVSSELRQEVLSCGVEIGRRVEIDIEALKAFNADAAEKLSAYDNKVRAFWDRYIASGEAGDCFVTLRTLATYTKVDRKGEKVYLKDQIKALEDINGIGEALAEVLGGVYDEVKLSSYGVEASKEGNLVTLVLTMPGKQEWPVELGGPLGRAEFGRVLTLKISHAKSHDRKNQRLLEVIVKAKEIWPV